MRPDLPRHPELKGAAMNFPHPLISPVREELRLSLMASHGTYRVFEQYVDRRPGAHEMFSTVAPYVTMLRPELEADPKKKQIIIIRNIAAGDLLKNYLRGFGVRILRGAVPWEQRVKALKDFDTDPECRVLISLASMFEGFAIAYPADTDIMTPVRRPNEVAQQIFRVRPKEPADLTIRLLYHTNAEFEIADELISALRNSALHSYPAYHIAGRYGSDADQEL